MMKSSRLNEFMRVNRIRPAEILSRVSYKRAMLDFMRDGRGNGSLLTMAETRAACQDILQREVGIEELFDFSLPVIEAKAAEG